MQREPEKRRAQTGRSTSVSSRSTGQRMPLGSTQDSSVADVESACRRIADYLLELAREGEYEPALGSLIEALDRGMRELEVDARIRAQRIHDTLQERRITGRDSRAVGQGCDPYFWG